jgi:hypothetical protein
MGRSLTYLARLMAAVSIAALPVKYWLTTTQPTARTATEAWDAHTPISHLSKHFRSSGVSVCSNGLRMEVSD